MDSVEYDSDPDGRNRLTLVKTGGFAGRGRDH
jgi:hypothetical protein